jgi:hypothetical protein
MLNTRDRRWRFRNPSYDLAEMTSEGGTSLECRTLKRNGKNRDEKVLKRLRMDHLNSEEKESLQKICSDYKKVFYHPGDKLSYTNALKHAIT